MIIEITELLKDFEPEPYLDPCYKTALQNAMDLKTNLLKTAKQVREFREAYIAFDTKELCEASIVELVARDIRDGVKSRFLTNGEGMTYFRVPDDYMSVEEVIDTAVQQGYYPRLSITEALEAMCKDGIIEDFEVEILLEEFTDGSHPYLEDMGKTLEISPENVCRATVLLFKLEEVADSTITQLEEYMEIPKMVSEGNVDRIKWLADLREELKYMPMSFPED